MSSSTPLQVAIIGSGYMGGGIAQVLALAGHRVSIADVSAEVAQRSLERLLLETEQFVADGLLPEGSVERIAEHVTAAESLEAAVRLADLIEEAVPERLELKRATLEAISAAARPDAVIGSNTSTILIQSLAGSVRNPERFLGVHFSNPAPFIPGVELIPHATTSEAAIALVESALHGAGKSTARVADTTGFVLNRLQYALFHEATQLVEEGIGTPDDIDTIVRTTFGFRLPFFGPFAIADMAGLDVYAFCYASLQSEFPERFATPKVLAELVDAGKLGVKSGEGFRAYGAWSSAELVEYRNRAYVEMQALLERLGPPPIAG